ncbi:hypothetical protein Y900_024820 [Mycolicibacterium aromaticivorans JS19b1 = JCM 16368]|uniref:Uncharacterized protein n=1 Tax=Mycolicibacterium aromaticivorans JS19b1 = JCM 16368 TaxID=1440774 RepID=A0A064CTL8_9MYCO|nr:hypothetical protein Y900_024820 [Mycolicibacterium aromaticivorans JS19b1 = JCM 16368]
MGAEGGAPQKADGQTDQSGCAEGDHAVPPITIFVALAGRAGRGSRGRLRLGRIGAVQRCVAPRFAVFWLGVVVHHELTFGLDSLMRPRVGTRDEVSLKTTGRSAHLHFRFR